MEEAQQEIRRLIKATWRERDAVREAVDILKAGGVGVYFTGQLEEYESELTEDLSWLVEGAKADEAASRR